MSSRPVRAHFILLRLGALSCEPEKYRQVFDKPGFATLHSLHGGEGLDSRVKCGFSLHCSHEGVSLCGLQATGSAGDLGRVCDRDAHCSHTDHPHLSL